MDDLTPREVAALDRAAAAHRDATTALQNATLAAMGASMRFDELGRTLLDESEQREFIAIAAHF